MPRKPWVGVLLLLLLFQGAPLASASSASSCADPLDVVLCLDGSGSMSTNYPKVQAFAQDFADKFTLGPTETGMAILRFSTSTVDGTGEGFSTSATKIRDAIDVPLPGGGTRTSKCLAAGEQQ